ncbi:hypothetical protein C0Q65_21595 [Streptomyces albidoflavus]|nr:hypothetical protein C0Q65_21595 [Streptomyces albidoflavus]
MAALSPKACRFGPEALRRRVLQADVHLAVLAERDAEALQEGSVADGGTSRRASGRAEQARLIPMATSPPRQM